MDFPPLGTPVTSLISIFVAGFASVFLLGFNSRNVNYGNYGWAGGTSLFIGLSQALIWKQITADEAGLAAALVYSVSGAMGITSSMYVHERFIKRQSTKGEDCGKGPVQKERKA